MATLADVKRWNGEQLEQIANTLRQRQQVLVNSGDEFTRALPVPGWTGPAAEAATAQHKTLTTWLDQAAGGVAAVRKALSQASDAIPAVQRSIIDAEELARKYGFRVTDAGNVVDLYAGRPAPPELHPDDRARARQEVTDSIAQALRTADDIDNDLTSVFQRAQRGEFGASSHTVTAAAAAGEADPGLTLPPPPSNATPAQNAGWWASLSPAGHAILAHDHPDWLGNLDGLPAAVRSAANKARLPAERAALQAQLAAAQQRRDQAAIDNIQAKLDSLDVVDTAMMRGNRQLLTLDTSGERVEAAVAVGDVDTAEHVAVFTPGLTTTVNGSLLGYDQDMYDLGKRAEDISTRYGDHGGVATVTWIGYQAPQLSVSSLADPSTSVANDADAKVGAANLDGFLNGIGAAHDVGGQPLHLTALGHSYGSLTTGIALHQQTPVHDAVVFGSPGLDATQRSDLHVPQGHMYAEWATGDPVPVLDKNFGTSPYPAMGWPSEINDINQMSTGNAVSVDGQPLHASYFHSQYLDAGTTSQYNMGVIVAGRPDLRIHG
jgi:hypothetical protein